MEVILSLIAQMKQRDRALTQNHRSDKCVVCKSVCEPACVFVPCHVTVVFMANGRASLAITELFWVDRRSWGAEYEKKTLKQRPLSWVLIC